MSNLKSVELYNFVTYRHEIIKFRKNSSYFVAGENKDTPVMGSNGVGKSLIFDAIAWCLFDKTVRGFSKDAVIGPYDKYAYVKEKWVDDEGRNIVVTRYRKHKQYKNEVVIKIDGKDASKMTNAGAAGSNAHIKKIFGVDGVAFLHSVVFSKGRDSLCEEKESGRRKLLSHILNLDRIDVAYKMAMKDHKKFTGALSVLALNEVSIETEITKCKSSLKDYREMLRDENERITKERSKFVSTKNERMRALVARYSKEYRQLLRIKKCFDQVKGVESEYKEIKAKWLKAERLLETKRKDILIMHDDLDRHESSMKKEARKKGTTCPSCKQKIDAKHVKKLVSGIRKNYNSLKGVIEEEKVYEKELKSKFEKLDSKKTILQKRMDRNIDAKFKHQKSVVDDIKDDIEELCKWKGYEDVVDNTDKIKKKIKRVKSELKQAEERKKSIHKEKLGLANKQKIAEFWKNGFSNKGLKSYIINGALDYLQTSANGYLKKLTDGYIRVYWQSEKQLKTNDRKIDNLSLLVKTGGRKTKEYHVCSNGEKARVWLAVELALNGLIRSTIDLALIDEAFDGLAPIGVTKVIKLLSDESQKRNIICLSHNPEVQKFFANKKKVVLEKDCSKIVNL